MNRIARKTGEALHLVKKVVDASSFPRAQVVDLAAPTVCGKEVGLRSAGALCTIPPLDHVALTELSGSLV